MKKNYQYKILDILNSFLLRRFDMITAYKAKEYAALCKRNPKTLDEVCQYANSLIIAMSSLGMNFAMMDITNMSEQSWTIGQLEHWLRGEGYNTCHVYSNNRIVLKIRWG